MDADIEDLCFKTQAIGTGAIQHWLNNSKIPMPEDLHSLLKAMKLAQVVMLPTEHYHQLRRSLDEFSRDAGRWRRMQSEIQRSSKAIISDDGTRFDSLSAAARQLGIGIGAVRHRLQKGLYRYAEGE